MDKTTLTRDDIEQIELTARRLRAEATAKAVKRMIIWAKSTLTTHPRGEHRPI